MSSLRSRAGRDRQPPEYSMRDAIALALDGDIPSVACETVAAYNAAMVPLSATMNQQLGRLRQLSDAGLVVASARHDRSHKLLHALGIRPIAISEILNGRSWPGVVALGCMEGCGVAQDRWISRMLARGAIVVSSDRSAAVPVIANGLCLDTLRPARRARIEVRPDLADLMALDGEWGRFVTEMHPPVRMAPGHLPLAIEQPGCTQIIARDAMTGEPLVVLAQVAGGQVLHSVAHWWQDARPDTTELGLRPLASMPVFAPLGQSVPEALLGGFGAGSVMLACLLAGLDIALDRASKFAAPTGVTSAEGGQHGPPA